jgi:hypothetical protein
MKTLVIHPNDPSTGFLDVLYKGRPGDFVILTEKDSNSKVDDMLRSKEFDCVMMLGHGTENGLLAPNGKNMYGRLIISARNVQALREHKKLIGIWCNANIFAEKYSLSGLFSGMVISELSEAADWNVPADEDSLIEHRRLWAIHLAAAIDKHPDNLEDICDDMLSHLNEKSSLLEKFNYESVYSF